MKFYIPHLRDRIKVTEDFTFPLHCESRNDAAMFGIADRREWPHTVQPAQVINGRLIAYETVIYHPIDVSIPAGTVLGIDRIFIRQGARDYDSVTFRSYGQGLPKGRFWIKLDDLNGMEFEKVVD